MVIGTRSREGDEPSKGAGCVCLKARFYFKYRFCTRRTIFMGGDASRDSELPSMAHSWPAIEAVGLTKKFGALTAVDAVTFDVEGARFSASSGPTELGRLPLSGCSAA